MTSREIDTMVMGFAVGALACLWLGYRLRVRVERWLSRRSGPVKRVPAGTFARETKHIPFGGVHNVPRSPQEARQMMRRQSIPLRVVRGLDAERTINHHVDMQRIPITRSLGVEALASASYRKVVNESDADRHLVIETLTSAGYRKVAAVVAVDACAAEERVSVEAWTVAALRNASTSKVTT